MNHKGTVPIETERLLLRPFIEADIQPAFANWTSDEAVTKFLRWPTHPDVETTTSVIREWIQSYSRKDFYQWAITLKGSDCGLVGTISVVELYEKTYTVHVGYCIGSRWWNQGITSEAFTGIIPFLFEAVAVKGKTNATYAPPYGSYRLFFCSKQGRNRIKCCFIRPLWGEMIEVFISLC